MKESFLSVETETVPFHSYRFKEEGSVIFLTGAPLSGKSTIAPIVAIQIKDCAIQHMDVIRSLSQEIETLKQPEVRNEFVLYGSTTAYTHIGNGNYTQESLIEGYIQYSRAVTKHFLSVLQQLNPEGISNMLIEGVQLLPEIVASYINYHPALLVILTSAQDAFAIRGKTRYSEENIQLKYNLEMLEIIQQEILRESQIISPNKLLIIDNCSGPFDTANSIITGLKTNNFIVPR